MHYGFMNQNVLIIFVKNLLQGKVKTRLAASIGHERAFTVYEQLLQYSNSICDLLPVDKIVFYSEFIDVNDLWNNERFEKQIQSGNDLGERMENAFAFAFQKKHKKAVIIGSDCSELTTGIIMNAFEYLNNTEVVIGPAKDGGYYLLGMNSMHYLLFNSITWSTGTVLNETLAIVNKLGLSYCLLPMLNDIDEEKDLRFLKENQHDKHHHSNI